MWWMSLTWFGPVACMNWFMDWIWQVWYGLNVGYEWRVVIKFGMSLVCLINVDLVVEVWMAWG